MFTVVLSSIGVSCDRTFAGSQAYINAEPVPSLNSAAETSSLLPVLRACNTGMYHPEQYPAQVDIEMSLIACP
jgi:hypothetical protein